MANVQHTTSNRISEDVWKKRKLFLTFGIPIVIFACIAKPVLLVAGIPGIFILASMIGRIETAGARGEDSAMKILSKLPDSYTLFNQLMIPNKHSKTGFTELDFIIVGDNALFVVEVKNNKGTILAKEDEDTWEVKKVSKKGNTYSATIKNPNRQLKRQVTTLNNYLKQKQLDVWIDGCLFFSNPAVKVKIKGETLTPIISKKSALIKYITTFNKGSTFNKEDVTIALAELVKTNA